MEYKYIGIVKYNGNHYSSGEIVKGSKIEWRDKELWLYDDEESYINNIPDRSKGYENKTFSIETTRYEWVEVNEIKEDNNGM